MVCFRFQVALENAISPCTSFLIPSSAETYSLGRYNEKMTYVMTETTKALLDKVNLKSLQMLSITLSSC